MRQGAKGKREEENVGVREIRQFISRLGAEEAVAGRLFVTKS